MNELQSLILRGMRDFFPATDKEILTEVHDGIKSGKYKLFFVRHSAFCLLYLPQSPIETPQVLHFYADKPALRRALVSRVLDFVKKSGYNKLRAMNGSGSPDEVWTRAFRHPGWKIKPIKTVFEFEVEK